MLPDAALGQAPDAGASPRMIDHTWNSLRTVCGLERSTLRLTCANALVQKYQGNGDQSGSRFSRNWSRPSCASSVM